jgi:hypothetical protein
MGLLKGLWNGLGDLYDSVGNTSNDDYNDNSIRQGSRKVRVTWRGNYKSTAGYWCTADVDEVISEDMYRRVSADCRATSLFLKRVIYDCEELESDITTLNFEGYVY